MSKEKVLLCWSGGKDSTLALHDLVSGGNVDVVSLLTTVTEEYDRISMHGVRTDLLRAQAKALGFPLTVVTIPRGCTNVQYEAGMEAALRQFLARGVASVAFGDIFLEDLKAYREKNLAKLGMKAVFPIWKRDTRELINSFIRLGYRAVLSCIDPRVLPRSFAGRMIDAEFVHDLPGKVDPCGENGEYHSFVFDGPLFSEPVRIARGESVERDGFQFCDLIPETREYLCL
jgi:uncharacterized protein (TIGR00290 family)